MTSTRFSLATVQVAVVFVAANFAAIRWGLGLPNLKANGMIQEIVIGGTPMASLLALGAVLAMPGPTRRSCTPFVLDWIRDDGNLRVGPVRLRLLEVQGHGQPLH